MWWRRKGEGGKTLGKSTNNIDTTRWVFVMDVTERKRRGKGQGGNKIRKEKKREKQRKTKQSKAKK